MEQVQILSQLNADLSNSKIPHNNLLMLNFHCGFIRLMFFLTLFNMLSRP